MSPMYRQGEAYPHPYPAYFSAPPNVGHQPIWLEPRETQPHYYYRETPKRPWPDECSYNKGRPYLYHYPAEGGYFYYPPRYLDSPPRFYEPDGMDFGRERLYERDGREFRRDFRPMCVYSPSSSAPAPYAYGPFHPDQQFRHPDEHTMRFTPASYGPSEQRKAHCCGCPNHVCHPQTKTMKETEPKQITDGNSNEELKPEYQKLQEFPGSVAVFPSGWTNRASSPERKDHIEEKNKYPVYWIPANWNRNDGEPSKDRKTDDKEQSPACWFPVNCLRNDQTQKHDPRFQGYLTPLASDTSPQNEKENMKDAPVQGKFNRFPLIWIPEEPWNVSNTNTREESNSPNSQASCENTRKSNEVESKPVILQELGRDGEKQGPAEVKKEIKVRDIPVKQLEEEKPAESRKTEKSLQPQKTQEKVGNDHHKPSSPKSSKLPPVCLRVDPLPGKKKSNGKISSSRSPSPPRYSENPKESDTFSAPMENAKPGASSKIFVEAKNCEEGTNMNASKKVEEKLDVPTKDNVGTGKPKEDVKLDDSKIVQNENMQNKEAKVKKHELSRDHAALKIQAFYRGCQVRRLQPLRKLREIAKIREHVKELKQQLSSPEFVGELSRDEKVKGRTLETLMGLLLELDTIQGLHPVVRDIRKAVARELVLLQEKLDTWTEVAPNNNMQQQQSCVQGSKEKNVRVEEEIIKKHGEDWQVTEDSDMTLLNSNIENHRVDNEASKDEKGQGKQDSLETKKETSDEDRKELPVREEINEEIKEATIKECSDDGKANVVLEQEDYATENSENVQRNAFNNQEAPGISENVDTSDLSVVMGNHDQDADVSGKMITTTDNTLENIDEDKYEKSEENISVSNSGELRLENMKAEVEEILETQMNIDSILPQDSHVQMEAPPSSTLVQEQEIFDLGNSTTLHQSTGDNAFQGKVVLGVSEAEPEEKLIKKEIEISYSEANKTETEDSQNVVTEEIVGDKQLECCVVVPSQAISDVGNSTTLHQSTDENEFQGEVVLGVPEAEPEKKVIKEEIEMSYSEANKTETEDLQNVVTEKIVGDKHLESSWVVSSQANSDTAFGSCSDGYEENNLILLEKKPLVEEAASGKREFAISLAQETYNSVNQGSVEVTRTEDASDVNSKDEFNINNEERQEDHALKCSGLSDDKEFRASNSAEKVVMEPLSPTNDSHSENLRQSQATMLQYGSKQNEENWEEENGKLKEMVEKLVESGKQQMSTIAQLNDKIKSLESKLSKGNGKKKARARHLRLKNNIVGSNQKNASALGY